MIARGGVEPFNTTIWRHGAGAMTSWRRAFIHPPPRVPDSQNSSSRAMAHCSADACALVWYFVSPFRPRATSPQGADPDRAFGPHWHRTGPRSDASRDAHSCAVPLLCRLAEFILCSQTYGGGTCPSKVGRWALVSRTRLSAQERGHPLPGARRAPSKPLSKLSASVCRQSASLQMSLALGHAPHRYAFL